MVLELSRDVIPDVNTAIARAKAIERSDLNGDGTVNLVDFAIFAEDYSLFMPKPEIKIEPKPAELPFYGDMNDPCFVEWYLTEYNYNH